MTCEHKCYFLGLWREYMKLSEALGEELPAEEALLVITICPRMD